MTTQNLYLDIYALQTVPSSNINRDDTGAPKTAVYGGVLRSRVSSQSWKKAIRDDFKKRGVEPGTGTRTKFIAKLLANRLVLMDSELNEEDALNKAADVLNLAGFKVKQDKKTKEYLSSALVFISQGQLDKLSDFVLSHDDLANLSKEEKEELKKIGKGNNNALDLALFGRMLADSPELNVEASAQVAHAISTHEIVPEFDYFTAVDDVKQSTGAAHLGTVEYNSSTLYRYANVNVNELANNLGVENAVNGVVEFIRSFVKTMPTGKQNTFANKTVPDYVMVCLRSDTPVNLVSAFEAPITSKGFVKKSVEALEQEYSDTEMFVDKPLVTAVVSKYDSNITENSLNLDSLLNEISETLNRVVKNENIND